MKQFNEIKAIKSWIRVQKSNGMTIGFVPTMGFLHEGHLSLVKKAKEENDIVILSIFVNPLQFGVGEDFEFYPKDEERDLNLAGEVGVDAVFIPSIREMYSNKMSATFKVHEGAEVLCGASRPGHFDGVATVVMKLFGIVTPDKAYFGLKDAQQVAVIERIVKDYHLDIAIRRGPTVRETDGLAKSSRNVNLTSAERREAPAIYKTLEYLRGQMLSGALTNAREVEKILMKELTDKLTATIDYAEVRAFPTLTKLDKMQGEIIVAVAVKYSKVRLIDNIIFTID